MSLRTYHEILPGLHCFMSAFDEGEGLFFGGDSLFRIAGIHQAYKGLWRNYAKYLKQMQWLLDVASGAVVWTEPTKWSTNEIAEHILGLAPSEDSDVSLPPYIESMIQFQSQQLTERIEFDLEEMKAVKDSPHAFLLRQDNVPSLANACNLFPYCTEICILIPASHIYNNSYNQSLVDDLHSVKNKNVIVELKASSLGIDIAAIFENHPYNAPDEWQLRIERTFNAVFLEIPKKSTESGYKDTIKLDMVEQDGSRSDFDAQVIEILQESHVDELKDVVVQKVLASATRKDVIGTMWRIVENASSPQTTAAQLDDDKEADTHETHSASQAVNAARQVDSPLTKFLKTYGLGKYDAALQDLGLRNLQSLASMEELQLQKLAIDINIRAKHSNTFHRAVEDLKSRAYKWRSTGSMPSGSSFFDSDDDPHTKKLLANTKRQLIAKIDELQQ